MSLEALVTALRILVAVHVTFLLGHGTLIAQNQAEIPSDTSTRLAGKWLLTSREGAGPYVLIFIQTGSKLRADFTADVLCDGTGLRMNITLEGEVHGRDVWLRPTKGRILSGRIDNELADRCSQYQVLTSSAHFRGRLSADGKTIVGPHDDTGDATHRWRFRRNG